MINRNIFEQLKEHLINPQATVITGMRRVGKTTALHYLLEESALDNKLYLDLEKIEYRALFQSNSYQQIENGISALGLNLHQPAILAIDELQLVQELPSVIKYLYDRYRIKFLLSGSSSYYLKNHFTESLAGRKRIFEMYPLSFGEYLSFTGYNQTSIEALQKSDLYSPFVYNQFKQAYELFLTFGGFPEVVMADLAKDKIEYLKDIINAYIELDIKLLSDFSKSAELYKLMQLLASRVGSRIDISKISSVSGINRNKISDYLELLEYTYFIHRIPSFNRNKDKEISAQKKLYLADTGILQQLAQVSSGQVFENAIALQLKQLGKLAFYQKKNGQEIDFILNENIAIEVKETAALNEWNTLNQRADGIGMEKRILIGRRPSNNTFFEWNWGGSMI